MDCCRFGRQIRVPRRGAFERLGTDAAQMAVTTGPVVKHLNVIEDVGPSEISGFVDAFADPFFFSNC